LRFVLAAGSVMSGESESGAGENRGLIAETQRASRIFLDEAVNATQTADTNG